MGPGGEHTLVFRGRCYVLSYYWSISLSLTDDEALGQQIASPSSPDSNRMDSFAALRKDRSSDQAERVQGRPVRHHCVQRLPSAVAGGVRGAEDVSQRPHLLAGGATGGHPSGWAGGHRSLFAKQHRQAQGEMGQVMLCLLTDLRLHIDCNIDFMHQ